MKISLSPPARILFALMMMAGSALAQTTYTWNSSETGNWSNNALWLPNGVPGADDIITAADARGQLRVNSASGNEIYGINVGGLGWTFLAGADGTSSVPRSYSLTVGAGGIVYNGTGTLLFRDNTANNHLSLNASFITINSGSVAFGSASSQPLTSATISGLTTVASGASLQVWANTATFAGGIQVNGGTVSIYTASSATGGSGEITVGGLSGSTGTVRTSTSPSTAGTVTIDLASGTASYGGVLVNGNTDNTLGVVKTGNGTQVFAGASTYSGGTVVSAGTLLVANASGSGLGTGAATVNGGRLGGTGRIALASNTLTVAGGGTLLGGDGVTATGTLSIDNALSLADDSTINLVLGADGTHSTIARTGSALWSFDSDQAFTFIDTGAEIGTYTGLITGLASDPGVGAWTINNAGWVGQFVYDDGSVNLELEAIPEPAISLLTLAAGLVFIIFRRNFPISLRHQ